MVSPSPLFYENETDPGTVDFKFEVEMEEKVDLATEDSPCSLISGIAFSSRQKLACVISCRTSHLPIHKARDQWSVGYDPEHTFATRRRPTFSALLPILPFFRRDGPDPLH